MLHYLWNLRSVWGIEIGGLEFKLAAFTDEVLLFLTDPITTIPNLIQALDLVTYLSNLKINFSKSMALNVTLDPAAMSQCSTTFLFRW